MPRAVHRRSRPALSIALTVALAVAAAPLNAQNPTTDSPESETNVEMDERLEGIVNAPDFPRGLDWFNTDRPISLRELRGKIVLLDFWTFCCINCMHVIPDLKRLEEKYADELVVIGVHSAKFANEKGSDAIRQAILRYEIEHPVVNDSGFQVWSEYAANAWPTFVFINPRGKVIGRHSGEGIYELFDAVIAQMIDYFDARGELKRGRLDLALERESHPNTLLSFPGKITTDTVSGRLFITDSNNNRIIVTDPAGAVLDVIGSGTVGHADGSFEQAKFDHPQGTFLEADRLYIADTENHLVRVADLTARTVTTLLGTGKQARRYNEPGAGTDVALNSPWDVLVHSGTLYIAMAGSHQIWSADLKTLHAGPFAGSAREDRVDGPRREAALAQPSGLSSDGDKLYFADSETSSIRYVEFGDDSEVKTLIGLALFEFGDRDGSYKEARLQHPLGVAFHKGRVWIADTYNSKIKIIDPVARTSTTYAGTGESGYADGPVSQAEFYEPGGLAFLGDSLYVADVNNHLIRVIDLNHNEVSTLQLSNLDRLHRAAPAASTFTGRVVELPLQKLAPGSGTIRLSFELPEGFTFAADAPSFVTAHSDDTAIVSVAGEMQTGFADSTSGVVDISTRAVDGRTTLTFDGSVYYCEGGSKLCLVDNLRLRLPLEVTNDAPSRLEFSVPVRTTPAGQRVGVGR